MFNKIPQSRWFLYLTIVGFLPLCFVAMLLYGQLEELEMMKEKVQHLKEMTAEHGKRQSINISVMNAFREADHFYIDKHLETLVFLDPEMEALQKIVNHKNFPGDPAIKKRLEHLSGSQNSLNFTEGVVQSFPFYQETMETLTHPVELNVTDLKNLLSKIEGVEIGDFKPLANRPQLLVMDFKIDRKRHADNNETFVLDMKLLKREYL